MVITTALFIYQTIKRFPLTVVFFYVLPFCVGAQSVEMNQGGNEVVENVGFEHTLESNSQQLVETAKSETKYEHRFNFNLGTPQLVDGYIHTSFQKLYILYQSSSDFKHPVHVLIC